MQGKVVGEVEDNTIWRVILKKSVISPGVLVSPARPSDKGISKTNAQM